MGHFDPFQDYCVWCGELVLVWGQDYAIDCHCAALPEVHRVSRKMHTSCWSLMQTIAAQQHIDLSLWLQEMEHERGNQYGTMPWGTI